MLEGWAVGPNTIGDDVMTGIPKHIKKLALSRDLKPTIRIGKSGISESLIAEINEQANANLIYSINEGERYTISKISTDVDSVYDKEIFFPLKNKINSKK